MNKRWFWKQWSPGDQKLFWLLASMGGGIWLIFFFVYFQNTSLAFVWEQFQQIEVIETTIRSFSVG
jgi:hypothetical protein